MMMMMMMLMAGHRLNSFAGLFVDRRSMASLLLLLLLVLPRLFGIAAAAAAAGGGGGFQSPTGISHFALQRVPLSSPAASVINPKTQSFVGNISLSTEEKENTESFEKIPATSKEEVSEEDETGQASKVTKPDGNGGNMSAAVVDRNGTLSVETKSQPAFHSTPTRQPYSTNGSGEVKAKVRVGSDPKQTTESAAAADATCCGQPTTDPPTTEATSMNVYNYNEYYDNHNDNTAADDDDDDDNDRGELEADDNNYAYNDSSDGKQALGDYREEDTEEDPAEASRPEYVYATDNVTNNETDIPSNQEQDFNSDPNYYYSQGAAGSPGDADWRASGPSADRVEYGGHSFAGSPPEYEAGSRDYHFGTKHRSSFDMYLGQKISEMRSGNYHGRQSLSLRWLEHRQVNHFAIFLWLVAAFAILGIVITAYRFRHSVYSAIQSTRTNYKQGRRIGIEEANDLLSHAQV